MADYKNKKKKRNFKKSKFTERTDKREQVDGYREDRETNDPAWYAQYPELMKDAASLPYSIPTGTKIKWDVEVDPTKPVPTQGILPYTAYQSVPGIMTFGIIPAIGISKDATSPVNVAAKLLYTKVRSENSGAKNYNSPDLLLYCLAMDQIYSLLTWYNRIYGKMMLYSQVNRYLPKALLKSEMVDFDDLILHINDFKAFIDTATAQAAAFSVPNDIKLFNRHAFMYQNIYKDAESPKSQIYQFSPRVFYQYDEFSGAGRLVAVDLYTMAQTLGHDFTFTDLVALFHLLMDPIIASEDFNIMSGDVLKAFGESNLIKLGLMPPGYTVIPITDYEVLTQMKNATLSFHVNGISGASGMIATYPNDWAIHQDANVEYIEWNPPLAIGESGSVAPGHVRDRMLSTYKTTPEPADNMVYSRLMFITDVTPNPNDSTKHDIYFDSLGSEFVVGATITQFHVNSSGVWTIDEYAIHTLSEQVITSMNTNNINTVVGIKHFDYCPAIYLFLATSASTYFWPIFDLDNWTMVHAYELEKMHRTAIMSMLRVPMIGSALSVKTK